MLRALAIFVAFALVSPAIRRFLLDACQTVDQLIQAHSVAAYVCTGLLGSASFIFIRLTSKN